jgi:hypothetical protein
MESTRTKEAKMTEATTHTIDAPGALLTYDSAPAAMRTRRHW